MQTNELSERLDVSIRLIQKTAKDLNISKVKGKYQFTDAQAERIANELNERKRTNENEQFTGQESDTIIEEFSAEEYEKLQEVISDYKTKIAEAKHLVEQIEILKNQLDYMKGSLDKKDDQINKLIESFQKTIQINSERNHLEYLDKKKPKG